MYRHLNIILWMTAFLTATAFPAQARSKQSLVLLMGAASSHQTVRAIRRVMENPALAEHVNLYYYTDEDLDQGKIDREIVKGSGLILLDDMYKTLSDYVLETADFKKTKVFGLSTAAREPGKIISDAGVKAYTRPLTQKTWKASSIFWPNGNTVSTLPLTRPRASLKPGSSTLKATAYLKALRPISPGTGKRGFTGTRASGWASRK